jgi:rhodanese-related sulfurtransferase
MAITTGTAWDIVLNAVPTRRAAEQAVSARAAYQDALHSRAVVVDLRPADDRAGSGAIHPDLGAITIEPRELPTWLVHTGRGADAILLTEDGALAAELATGLDAVGIARTTYVAGGFTAWRAAGLPVISAG